MNDPAYLALDHNPLDETVSKINSVLNELHTNNHVSLKIKNNLKMNINNCKVGSFRMMAKLHKKSFGWRPILNCINHPTSKLSMFFDFLIKPIIVESTTYIKDSQNLIQLTENLFFKRKPFLYSLDVSSLYPSIDPFHAIPLITEFMSKFLDSTQITNYGFKALLFLFFENNIFQFKDSFFIQTRGLPMGCICGPAIANLYLFILEQKWLILNKPIVYYRFIDDIFLALDSELDFANFEATFVYLKLSVSSGDIVSFLDLNISYNSITKQLRYSLYTKETYVNKFLLPNSNHPEHIFKNIPHSLFIRIRRICSDYIDFIDAAKKLRDNLLERGYDLLIIRSVFNNVSNLDRESLLPYKIKNKNLDFSKNIPFFFHFNSNFNNFNNLVYSSFSKSKQLFPILNNFNLKFINNIETNLNSLFVHNFNLSFPLICKTYKCGKCRICNYIYNNSYIKLNNSICINLLSSSNCLNSHLIYIILCTKCKIFYVGETKMSLFKRISQHLDSILNFIPFKKHHNKEVARHFNLNGHNLLSDFKCCIFKDKLFETNKRESAEIDLIQFINKYYFNNCINIHKKRNSFQSLAFM